MLHVDTLQSFRPPTPRLWRLTCWSWRLDWAPVWRSWALTLKVSQLISCSCADWRCRVGVLFVAALRGGLKSLQQLSSSPGAASVRPAGNDFTSEFREISFHSTLLIPKETGLRCRRSSAILPFRPYIMQTSHREDRSERKNDGNTQYEERRGEKRTQTELLKGEQEKLLNCCSSFSLGAFSWWRKLVIVWV